MDEIVVAAVAADLENAENTAVAVAFAEKAATAVAAVEAASGKRP
jgi:hypothetical protein